MDKHWATKHLLDHTILPSAGALYPKRSLCAFYAVKPLLKLTGLCFFFLHDLASNDVTPTGLTLCAKLDTFHCKHSAPTNPHLINQGDK